MGNIKFLHLTDLHLGDKYQKGLFSQAKKIIFDDIEYLIKKMEGLDIVFFSGDFVQRGSKAEFEMFEGFLKELWDMFARNGQTPTLFHVPGNHDVERVEDENNPVHKIMLNWTEENLKNEYFWTSPNDYHEFIQKRFLNYSQWAENTSIPTQITKTGFIAGDFYSTIRINDVNVGVVGLNSTFLQLSGGDFKKKLGIYNKQISYMFNDAYFDWLHKQDLVILMTHQAPDWYEESSANEYLNEIYAQGCFAEHICGHMHEPSFESTSINGFPARQIFLSPSLFGLEYVGENKKLNRIHGYTGGIYHVNGKTISKTIWPRISVSTKFGLKITQNEEFNLDKDSASMNVILKDSKNEATKDVDLIIEKLENDGRDLFSQIKPLDKGLNRTFYNLSNRHDAIRDIERTECCNHLKQNRLSWVTTGFGLAHEEFIGSCLSESNVNHNNCFTIDCDGVESINQLTEKFRVTFSKNITQFFDIVSSLDRPLLVFTNFSTVLERDPVELKEYLQTIFDFSPTLKVLIVSDVEPQSTLFPYIQLTPLDIHSLMQYVKAIKEIQIDFSFLEYEKILRISSGIPTYIDEIANQLEFRPLSDLGDLEFDQRNNDLEDIGISKVLMDEIDGLKTDTSKSGRRKFSALCVLSLLHNGETFDRIKRFDQSAPFYPDDIKFLLDNKLAEAIRISSIFDNSNKDSEVLRVIKIPRIVRDYITQTLPVEEKVDVYKKVCDIYLGTNWRQRIKLIQPKEAELELIVHQNLQIALRFLMLNSVETQNEIEMTRIVRISIELAEYFSDRGAYKEAIFLSEEILKLVKDANFTDLEKSRTSLSKKLGENLRMSGTDDRGLNILKAISEDENNSLGKDERNHIRLTLAVGYKDKDKNQALEYAEQVKRNEKDRESSDYLTAEWVTVHYIENEDERKRKLNALKNKSDKLGYSTLHANIILGLNNGSTDDTQLKQIDKVIINSKGDTYTKVRALLAKANIVLNSKKADEITNEDLLGLNISYSYSFYQRLSTLLSKCHVLAWNFWLHKKAFDQLLNIFRYSSFVWRLCGETDFEKIFLKELNDNKEFNQWFVNYKNTLNGNYYEQRLAAINFDH